MVLTTYHPCTQGGGGGRIKKESKVFLSYMDSWRPTWAASEMFSQTKQATSVIRFRAFLCTLRQIS